MANALILKNKLDVAVKLGPHRLLLASVGLDILHPADGRLLRLTSRTGTAGLVVQNWLAGSH